MKKRSGILRFSALRRGTEYSQERRNDEITILANCSYGTLEGDVGNSAGIQGIQFSSIAGKIYERANLDLERLGALLLMKTACLMVHTKITRKPQWSRSRNCSRKATSYYDGK
jgi:hypothetical protein